MTEEMTEELPEEVLEETPVESENPYEEMDEMEEMEEMKEMEEIDLDSTLTLLKPENSSKLPSVEVINSEAISPKPYMSKNNSQIQFTGSGLRSRNSQIELKKKNRTVVPLRSSFKEQSVDIQTTFNSSIRHKPTCKKYNKLINVKLKIGNKTMGSSSNQSEYQRLKSRISIIDQNKFEHELSSVCSCKQCEDQELPYVDLS